jgi:DNA-nicking Smr family endonuclease
VLMMEDVEQDPEMVAQRLISHAELSMSRYPPLNETEARKKVFANSKERYRRDKVPKEAKRRLKKAYAPTVVWLADIIGDERVYDWVV